MYFLLTFSKIQIKQMHLGCFWCLPTAIKSRTASVHSPELPRVGITLYKIISHVCPETDARAQLDC